MTDPDVLENLLWRAAEHSLNLKREVVYSNADEYSVGVFLDIANVLDSLSDELTRRIHNT
jgi:hypothetical protein